MRKVIKTVGLIWISSDRLLLVRPRKAKAFYMPGGKPLPGEGDIEALHREIKEELGTSLTDGEPKFYGTFEAQAYGEPADTQVQIKCYTSGLRDVPAPHSEVAEIRLFTYGEYCSSPITAPAVVLIMMELRSQGLIK
jgi:8-oxo-dGTP pyrophosphatase MutT (NUDIX family)